MDAGSAGGTRSSDSWKNIGGTQDCTFVGAKEKTMFLIHVKEYGTYISWRPKEHICIGDKYAGNSLYNRETYILYMKHNITLTNTSIDRWLVPIKLSGRFLEIKLFSSRLRKWQNCVAGSHADEWNLSKYFQVLAHSTS
jgi:hypothetical protein